MHPHDVHYLNCFRGRWRDTVRLYHSAIFLSSSILEYRKKNRFSFDASQVGMKVVSGFSFVDWCPAVGTCRLLCLWSIMRGNGRRKRGQQWEHREDARGFMCNSCLQNWPLCSMSFVSNFLKNIPFLQCVFRDYAGGAMLENNLVHMEQVASYLQVL